MISGKVVWEIELFKISVLDLYFFINFKVNNRRKYNYQNTTIASNEKIDKVKNFIKSEDCFIFEKKSDPV
jgi:hypothetical protein